ncbi:RING finger and transmembrane domain-containing protein 2-like [Pyrus ussuriensis x Pyrus communis]|uniref:RING finger and transmembrane domain-containing protein 2-like n=1 Tax=Pyrus ussuriensis x Pyrus communis TaxID=2448454 RepID=A0A5N5F2R3_9ROSA|nr:RING finger and transmembrane domain-containing protein 2-like [Pyrus ussuriensis x Pyrus communis]
MEASSGNSSPASGGATEVGSNTSSFGSMQFPALRFFQSPLSFVLDYSGILSPSSSRRDSDAPVVNAVVVADSQPHSPTACTSGSSNTGEVSIRIIGAGEQEDRGNGGATGPVQGEENDGSPGRVQSLDDLAGTVNGVGSDERVPLVASSSPTHAGDTGNGAEDSSRDSAYQRYDIQQIARWIEQILPFSLLLLVVFIRQHLQGFFVTIWVSAVMYRSNDVVKKQTSLKGDRKISVLVSIAGAFMLHVVVVYWWYRSDDLLYPLAMLPPKTIPPFWHAIFIILVNDTMVRQAAMAFKCLLLICYKNGRGHNYRRQGQMLTVIEYTLLLYRALLPAPVWYRFFLNKDNGSLFSSLTTGLYLTFKLTSVVEKVQSFLASIRALSRKDIHYGSHATLEQVNAAGDLCAICQEKMHAPILLRCKHIFCEDCVSEWFERERTCPLCRALVKPADLRTYGDGSTSLIFQLF